MAEITIHADTSKVDVFLDAFPREAGKAILRALRRATAAAGTHANRVVSRDMGLKVGDVRKRIRVKQPTGSRMEGSLHGSLKRVPLIEFRASGPEPSRGKGRGVSYRVGRGGRKRHPHAFIATVGSGHRGVFERRTETALRRGKPHNSALPIRELYGPSVGRVLSERQDEVKARGTEVFEKELDRLLDRITGRFGGTFVAGADFDA